MNDLILGQNRLNGLTVGGEERMNDVINCANRPEREKNRLTGFIEGENRLTELIEGEKRMNGVTELEILNILNGLQRIERID